MDFVNKDPMEHICDKSKSSDIWNILRMPMESIIQKESPYFIDDVLHLRVEVCIIRVLFVKKHVKCVFNA
ncbi:hypothetical protein QJS10_CPA03g01075 [Acorus calamus]|uniref:Uncharacterized protein n=1 Tax=Acorus calamus TaxID=4465 RepID=A0AAV9F4K4_ACOCL|nr:hypothetical protein QJS10_CPA03g01075 [Acorus calamus]